jgi:hypothetical protein
MRAPAGKCAAATEHWVMASHRPTVKPLTPVRDRSEMAGRTAVPALAVAPGTGAAVAEAIGA